LSVRWFRSPSDDQAIEVAACARSFDFVGVTRIAILPAPLSVSPGTLGRHVVGIATHGLKTSHLRLLESDIELLLVDRELLELVLAGQHDQPVKALYKRPGRLARCKDNRRHDRDLHN
jgi:hypothetical protein